MATDLGVHFWSSSGGGGGGGGGGTAPYAGTQTLASGITSQAITFSVALATLPAVVCWLSSSDPAASIITSQGSDITTGGFTAQLGATTPDTTYTLNWIASVAND